MPTPFYHLSIAEELLASPDLPQAVSAFLHRQRGAFLLGKTAPDVQSLSGQSRTETHFYRVPLTSQTPPWERMFNKYIQLGRPALLQSDQAAFIAGYICHLQADVIWITDLFVPYFLPMLTRHRRKRVGYLHNVLRAYLDEHILADLPADVGQNLSAVVPIGWLPFVDNSHMLAWRDYLAGQLAPGAEIQTVAVFAQRMDIPINKFLGLIQDEMRMAEEIFSFIPYQVLVEYRDKLVSANIQLLTEFLADVATQGE